MLHRGLSMALHTNRAQHHRSVKRVHAYRRMVPASRSMRRIHILYQTRPHSVITITRLYAAHAVTLADHSPTVKPSLRYLHPCTTTWCKVARLSRCRAVTREVGKHVVSLSMLRGDLTTSFGTEQECHRASEGILPADNGEGFKGVTIKPFKRHGSTIFQICVSMPYTEWWEGRSSLASLAPVLYQ